MNSKNPLWRFPGLNILTLLFFLFLFVPIFILVVLSFNANNVATIWTGFTTRWYGVVFDNPNIVRAMRVSLLVALAATVLSTVFATLAALGTNGAGFRGQPTVAAIIGLPLLVPEIVTAVASLLFFLAIGLQLSVFTLILAHTVFCIPFAYLPIRARLVGLDSRLLEAASDLGAAPWRAFWRVTWPLVLPGVVSGAMLAFIASLDDFLISSFVAGAGATTLPVYIFGMIRIGITPEVNAVSSVLLLASVLLVVASYVVGRWDTQRGERSAV